MLGVDVLQHCASSKRSSVSNVSGEVLDAHPVRAGNADEGQTVLLSIDAVHIIKSTECLPVSMWSASPFG